MPWLAIKLFLGGALKRLSGLFAWATASATRMLAAALCVALLGGIWAYKGWSRDHDALKAEKMGRASDNVIFRKSLATDEAAIKQQNDAYQAISDASAAKQKASQQLVDKALTKSKVAEAAARSIEQERKTWPRGGPVCRTGEAVMSARNSL